MLDHTDSDLCDIKPVGAAGLGDALDPPGGKGCDSRGAFALFECTRITGAVALGTCKMLGDERRGRSTRGLLREMRAGNRASIAQRS